MVRSMVLSSVLGAAVILTCPGCGSSQKVEVAPSQDNIGKQLQDLDQAYQDGIINKSEYDKAKKRILDGK